MNKSIILMFIMYLIGCNLLSETFSEKYDLKNRTIFSTQNHPKAKGINMTIKYPSFWEASEGDRPNVVHKFQYYDDDIIVETSIVIMSPVDDSRSDKAIAYETFQKQYLKNLLPDIYTYIDGDVTTYDNLRGCWIAAKFEQSGAGVFVSSYALLQMFIYEKRSIILTHSISNTDLDADPDLFLQYLPIFTIIGSSIVLPDQWE